MQRKELQRYPSWQGQLEDWQMKLNKASVYADMKAVGHYNTLINQYWDSLVSKGLVK